MRGYVFIAAGALLWGIAATLGRAAFTGKLAFFGTFHPIDPVILSQTRATFSLAALVPVLLLRGGWARIRMPQRDLISCLVLGMFGIAASNYFYYLAIQRTSVAIAIILQYTAPVWVLLYVVARGQQKPSLQKISAVGVAITGIALVIGLIGPDSARAFLHIDSYGLLGGLVASFSFAFYNVGAHRILARYDRWRVLVWTLASAFTFWLLLNPPWKVFAAHYGQADWIFLFVFSMVSVLVPFSLYFLGLQYLEPTRAIIVSCLEPVFSIVLAAVFLGEVLHAVQSFGIVLVLAAIVIVQLPGRGEAGETVVCDPIE